MKTKTKIEHSYLLHIGFNIDSRNDIAYGFGSDKGWKLYTNVYYYHQQDNYSIGGEYGRYTFVELIAELTPLFQKASTESFKLYNRSETIKLLTTTPVPPIDKRIEQRLINQRLLNKTL